MIATDDDIRALMPFAKVAAESRPAPAPKPKQAPKPAAAAAEKSRTLEEPSFAKGNPQALEFDNPLEMLLFYRPAIKPYAWQRRELLRVAGYTNVQNGDVKTRVRPTAAESMYYTLVAANGSGKDAYFICPTAVWFIASKIRAKCVITSSTDEQLVGQTFAAIKGYCELINARHGVEIFEIVEKLIRCHRTGSEIRMFVTNKAGRAEGHHPFDDHPDGPEAAEFMFIANEAKTIDDPLWTGFDRYTGHNYWLEVSSPGQRAGHFYNSVSISDRKTHTLGKYYCTKVTAFDCPHIGKAHLDMMRLRHGTKSLYWLTSVLAEFYEDADATVIPYTLTLYTPPAQNTYGLPLYAGLDLSLGGDETVMSIWRGNRRVAQETCHLSYAPAIRDWVIEKINQYGLSPQNVNADGGGLGSPIIHSIREAGYDIVAIKNDEAPYDKKNYRNRGSEMWFRFKRLVEEKILILPAESEDGRFIHQLTSRRYELSDGRTKLESKADAKSRGAVSPDRADAAVLAFATIPLSVFLGVEVGETDEERRFREQLVRPITITPENFAKMERKLREDREAADKPQTTRDNPYIRGMPRGTVNVLFSRNQYAKPQHPYKTAA